MQDKVEITITETHMKYISGNLFHNMDILLCVIIKIFVTSLWFTFSHTEKNSRTPEKY